MKKILLIVLILVLLGAAAAALFIASFDLDRYRPGITRSLEETLEKPVTLEKMALAWRGGLALTLQDLVVYKDNTTRQELLRLKSLGALMNPLALLNRRLEISSLFLTQPQFFLTRNGEGKIRGFEARPKRKLNLNLIPLLAAVSLRIEKVKLEGGEVVFQDEAHDPPLEIRLTDVGAVLKNVAWNSPVQIKGRASFLSPQRNLDLAGEIRMTPRGPTAENVRLDLDLSALDWEQAERALPFLPETELRKGTRGKFLLLIPNFQWSREGFENLDAQLQFNDGQIVLADLGVPIARINSSMRAEGGQFDLEDFSAAVGDGEIHARGTYNRRLPSPLASIQLRAEGIDLDKIFPSVSSEPRLEGRASVAFEGTIQGTKTAFLKNTLAGKGTLRLEEPVIRNFNFLNEVFSRIGIIPGLVDKLRERLPTDYQERLLVRDTPLHPLGVTFAVDQGSATFQNFSIVADSFQLVGMGQVNLSDQTVFMQTLLYVEADLSKAIIRSVNELQYLSDAEGRLQIPLILQGTFRDISLRPELQYIASRLAVTKATEVLSDWLLKKKKDDKESPGSTGTGSGQNLLGDLLQSALRSRTGDS